MKPRKRFGIQLRGMRHLCREGAQRKRAVVAYGATFEGDTTRTRAGFSNVGGTRSLYRRRIGGAE